MFSFLLMLAAAARISPFVEAACIPTVRSRTATPTTSSPNTALITGQPDLRPRDVNSICASYSTWITAWETSTISCDTGIPCVYQSYQPGTIIGYCSSKDAQVKTEAFNYGQAPSSGCSPGQLCCDSTNPGWGVYAISSSSFLTMCGSTRFWQTAMATIAAVQAPSVTTSSSTSASASASATATTPPASNNDSSNKLSTSAIIGIVFGALGGIGAFTGGVIALIRYFKNHPDHDDNKGKRGGAELMHLNHSGAINSRPELHFHGTVNVMFRDSEVHLSGGPGGMGSNLRVIGNGPNSGRNGSRMMITQGRR